MWLAVSQPFGLKSRTTNFFTLTKNSGRVKHMFRIIRFIFKPLHSISKSLELLCKLYSADLASRTPPVYLVTEEPSEDNTEVWYGNADTDGVLKKRRKFGNPKDWFNKEVDIDD